MNENEFWTLIDNSRAQTSKDDDAFLELLQSKLQALSKEEIVEFECLLRKMIIQIDHFDVMAVQKIVDGSVSDDGYLYFRAWVVSQGKEAYYKILNDTDNTATLFDTNEAFHELELLLYVAESAYKNIEKSICKESPRSICIDRGFDYEGIELTTKGEDWEEEDLPKRFPKLWDRWGS